MAGALSDAATASLSVGARDGARLLAFAGTLDARHIAGIWTRALREATRARGAPLVLDLGAVRQCDTAGAAFLTTIERAHGGDATVAGADERVTALLARARAAAPRPAPPQPPAPPTTVRGVALAALRSAAGGIAYVGEAAIAFLRLPARRRMLRVVELLRYADQAGVRAMPLIVLLGYLIGLILAFQSAIPMRKFGAELYVASLVAISLLRELGPLMAAVILAGRSGSAFAAEIGTMKVNEEIDALVTMGLDPMTMLVLPRLIAAMIVMPAMTIALDLAGLAGMTTVMASFGFPLVTIANQVATWATSRDLIGGLVKAACFGAAVAAIGCREGLATGVGPRAVGQAATGAVVGGIVATILLDGVFALIFFRLGL
jgi:phospholipid/cholesterol/gamma-HCH transport system permease protein